MSLRRAIRQVAARHLRRALIELLALEPARRMSLARLRDTAREAGQKAGAEHIDDAVDWLANAGLVARGEAASADADDIALTSRGLDVAERRLRLPGIAPAPPPGDD